jgi:hypothetical protein
MVNAIKQPLARIASLIGIAWEASGKICSSRAGANCLGWPEIDPAEPTGHPFFAAWPN